MYTSNHIVIILQKRTYLGYEHSYYKARVEMKQWSMWLAELKFMSELHGGNHVSPSRWLIKATNGFLPRRVEQREAMSRDFIETTPWPSVLLGKMILVLDRQIQSLDCKAEPQAVRLKVAQQLQELATCFWW